MIIVVGTNSAVGKVLTSSLPKYWGVDKEDLDLSNPYSEYEFPKGAAGGTLIHLAALSGGETDEEMMQTELVNAVGTLKVCQLAYKAGIKRIILISSIFTIAVNLDDIYSLSKRHSEELAEFYCATHNISLTILRPSRIYGDESFRKNQPFFYDIVDKAKRGEEIEVRQCIRNYIHVDDLVKIILSIIDDELMEGYCSYTSSKYYSLKEIAETANKIFENKIPVKVEGYGFYDCFECEDTLNPPKDEITLEEGIKRML